MKKLFSLLWAALLVMGLTLPAEAHEEAIGIRTREDLEAIARNPKGAYILQADIDLGDRNWVPIPFEGRLDGNGHTIYNLQIRQPGIERAETVDGNHKSYDTVFAGLFSTVRNAEIRDLHILGADLSVETAEHCFAGILTGYLENSSLIHCSVEGRAALRSTNVMEGIGGLAGFGSGHIQDCSVSAELTFADRREHGKKPRCEQFMGGLLACGNADLIDNRVEIQGYDACWGYVHNGGLIGMHDQYRRQIPNGQIVGNTVSGAITFFENNPDRRAYCSAYAGELLTTPSRMLDNQQDFRRNELYNRTEELSAHSCKSPAMEETTVPHTDSEWGYTLHRCSTCGYEFKDCYQAPGHVPGPWEVLQEPDYETEGLKRQCCSVCGQELQQQTIPRKSGAASCKVTPSSMILPYRHTADLTVEILPEDLPDQEVFWESSDPDVVSVDSSGRITALQRGQANITCRTADAMAESSCYVTVDFSPWQWLIEIFLFGWLWY